MNVLDYTSQEKLLSAFGAGLSIRAAAAFADVNRKTADRYFKQQPPILCPCGRPLPHREWCSWRVAMSPSRQRFLSSFARGGIKNTTLDRWGDLKTQVQAALAGKDRLCAVDQTALSELKRFYTIPNMGWEGSGENSRMVAIADATQESTSFALFAALDRLHPAVKKFVLAITDGAGVEDAAAESGLSDAALAKVMPRLKVFLKPYLTQEAS